MGWLQSLVKTSSDLRVGCHWRVASVFRVALATRQWQPSVVDLRITPVALSQYAPKPIWSALTGVV
jgi:hypothetical protein